jgi:hypothetical protein
MFECESKSVLRCGQDFRLQHENLLLGVSRVEHCGDASGGGLARQDSRNGYLPRMEAAAV